MIKVYRCGVCGKYFANTNDSAPAKDWEPCINYLLEKSDKNENLFRSKIK